MRTMAVNFERYIGNIRAHVELLAASSAEYGRTRDDQSEPMRWLMDHGLTYAVDEIYGLMEEMLDVLTTVIHGQSAGEYGDWGRAVLLRARDGVEGVGGPVISPETFELLEYLRTYRDWGRGGRRDGVEGVGGPVISPETFELLEYLRTYRDWGRGGRRDTYDGISAEVRRTFEAHERLEDDLAALAETTTPSMS